MEKASKKTRPESDRAKLVREAGPLPPPGDNRRELLARRKAKLEAKLQKIMDEEQIIGGTIPLKDMDIEREIWHALQEMRGTSKVVGAQNGFVYAWVICKLPTGQPYQAQIDFKKGLGWVVVQGEDPEERRKKTGVDTCRYWADCLLMRIPERRYEVYCRVMHKMTMDKYGANVDETAGGNLAVVHTDPDDPIFKQWIKDQYVDKEATTQYTRMMQQGRIPGAEPGFELER